VWSGRLDQEQEAEAAQEVEALPAARSVVHPAVVGPAVA
jgi:hypothetical protein